MNLLKKSMRLARIFAFALSFLILCSSTAAMAATITFDDAVMEFVPIRNGGFTVNKQGEVPSAEVIESAKVLLLDGETGTINQITITGPNGENEFSCSNVEVKNGTDLIQQCKKGPVRLVKGETTYQAHGSNFGPRTNTILGVDLIS